MLYPCKAYTIIKLKNEKSQARPHSNLIKYSATAWDVTYPRNNFTNWAELWAATTPVGASFGPSSGPSPMDRVRECDKVKRNARNHVLPPEPKKKAKIHASCNVSNFLSRPQALFPVGSIGRSKLSLLYVCRAYLNRVPWTVGIISWSSWCFNTFHWQSTLSRPASK